MSRQTRLKDFRRSVYQDLLAPAYVRNKTLMKNSSRGNPPSPSLVSIKKHKPEVPRFVRLAVANHQPVRGTSRRCSRCSTKKEPVRTIWSCKICNVPLCYREGKSCFEDHHKQYFLLRILSNTHFLVCTHFYY